GGRLRSAFRRSRNEGRPACGSGAVAAWGAVDITPSCRDRRAGATTRPAAPGRGPSGGSVEQHIHAAGKGLDVDRAAAGAIAVLHAGARPVALAYHAGAGGVDVTAEGAGFQARGGVGGKGQADVAADRLEAEAATLGNAGADGGVAGYGADLQ